MYISICTWEHYYWLQILQTSIIVFFSRKFRAPLQTISHIPYETSTEAHAKPTFSSCFTFLGYIAKFPRTQDARSDWWWPISFSISHLQYLLVWFLLCSLTNIHHKRVHTLRKKSILKMVWFLKFFFLYKTVCSNLFPHIKFPFSHPVTTRSELNSWESLRFYYILNLSVHE